MANTASDYFLMDFVAGHINKAAEQVRQAACDNFLATVYAGLGAVESPLEAAFFGWWVAKLHSLRDFSIWLEPQREVVVESQRYRLDFQVVPTRDGEFRDMIGHPAHPAIAIELDGHEFHERTKEQVTSRNQRDRALTLAGWTVLHFSGTEIHRHPEHVVWHEAHQRCVGMFCRAMTDAGFWKGGTLTHAAPVSKQVDA